MGSCRTLLLQRRPSPGTWSSPKRTRPSLRLAGACTDAADVVEELVCPVFLEMLYLRLGVGRQLLVPAGLYSCLAAALFGEDRNPVSARTGGHSSIGMQGCICGQPCHMRRPSGCMQQLR